MIYEVDGTFLSEYKRLVEVYGNHLEYCCYKDTEFCDCGFLSRIKNLQKLEKDLVKLKENKYEQIS